MKVGFRTCQLVLDSDSTVVEKISIDYKLADGIKINNLNSNESAGWKLVAPTSVTNSGTWTYENSSKTVGKTILGEVELEVSTAGSYTFEIRNVIYAHKDSAVEGTSDNNLRGNQSLSIGDQTAIAFPSDNSLSLKYLEIDGMEILSLNENTSFGTKKDSVKVRVMVSEESIVSVGKYAVDVGGFSNAGEGDLFLEEGKNEFLIIVENKTTNARATYTIIIEKKSETITTVDTNKTTTKNNNQTKTASNTVVKNPATGDDFIKYGAIVVILLGTIVVIKKKITKLN